jgi:hypothetical protein
MPPRTRKTPAEAAEAEATATPDTGIVVPFRGRDFTVDQTILTSTRFGLALAANRGHEVLFELLGPEQAGAFIALCTRGEQLAMTANEFLDALNEASPGNS